MRAINLFNVNKDLFEIICLESTLLEGFIAVKRNKGAPGIDGVTIEEFETNLHKELAQLSKELINWSYKSRPVRSVEIPKPGDNTGTRELGIPCVRDRIVQAAIKQTLEPLIDPKFSSSNYGFRPGKSQKDAIESAQKIVQSGKEWCVDIDLAKFFDTISQDRLIYRLSQIIPDKRVLRLIGNILRSGIMRDGSFVSLNQGTVQGSPLSPLLSNVVLDELDKELEKRGLSFARWADDCNIFVSSQKSAERVMKSITNFIESKLKLKVNLEKSKVALTKQVKFLGMTIIVGTLAIAQKSMVRAMEKVKELTPRNKPIPIEIAIENINTWYTGWAQYFSMTQYPSQFRVIESHIRRRLRARIVKNSKRRKYLYKKIVNRGVKSKTAARCVFSSKGPWALSNGAINYAYNIEWFIKMGQKTFSNKQLPHWYPVNKWIKLT